MGRLFSYLPTGATGVGAVRPRVPLAKLGFPKESDGNILILAWPGPGLAQVRGSQDQNWGAGQDKSRNTNWKPKSPGLLFNDLKTHLVKDGPAHAQQVLHTPQPKTKSNANPHANHHQKWGFT